MGLRLCAAGRRAIRMAVALIVGLLLVAVLDPGPVAVGSARHRPAATAALGTTVRASVAYDGSESAEGASREPVISADGQVVVFVSDAPNFDPVYTNRPGRYDIFLRDRTISDTVRVSLASDGTQGNNDSYGPDLSDDGMVVAFYSYATDLVSGDDNGHRDVFVHDRTTGETTRVSVSSDGEEGSGSSDDPSISAEGRYIAFVSSASNLVAGDTNDNRDVFVHDRATTETTRVSVSSGGGQAIGGNSSQASISGDGRYVAFSSSASDLVAGDTNGTQDVFVHDRQISETVRVSLSMTGTSPNGLSQNPSISASGRYVVFASAATNIVPGDSNGKTDCFVNDTVTGDTKRVSVSSEGDQSNGGCAQPAISPDGRFVAYRSSADNLVAGDDNEKDDIFLHNVWSGETLRASVSSDGEEGNETSRRASVANGGRAVAFHSKSDNLVTDDTTHDSDVFVHEPPSHVYVPLVLLGTAG